MQAMQPAVGKVGLPHIIIGRKQWAGMSSFFSMGASMRLSPFLISWLVAGRTAAQIPTPQSGGKHAASAPATAAPLVPPMLLQKQALEAGNPLATYAAMLELEPRYRDFKPLAGIYDEIRYNF